MIDWDSTFCGLTRFEEIPLLQKPLWIYCLVIVHIEMKIKKKSINQTKVYVYISFIDQ